MTDGNKGLNPLALRKRPLFERAHDPLSVVDLFAGCGGLTLGVAQAAEAQGRGLDVRLAVEINEIAAEVYKANFPGAREVVIDDILTIFPSELETCITAAEKKLSSRLGKIDVLVGGPPCQGHSSLNNHTRRDDPRNALYTTMARAAEVLSPDFLLIENVPAVLNDKYKGQNVVAVVRAHLSMLGYEVADGVVSLHKLGVPQKRRRHILLAARKPKVEPEKILSATLNDAGLDLTVDLRWAIGDLTCRQGSIFDQAPKPSAENLRRMNYLLESGEFDLPNRLRPTCHQGQHSYKSMYGRLAWDQPAQTITSGFGSIGQGRYMHPDQPRALTPHEAARIQGFPDYFEFATVPTRGALATMIGNAVPPQLARHLLIEYLSQVALTSEV